ncbi:hypothetical protein ACKWTF_002187 [Chironomus riparius]
MENLERKLEFLEGKLHKNQEIGCSTSIKNNKIIGNEVTQIRNLNVNSNESQIDAFYDKLGKNFNQLMKLEEKLSNASADIDKNQLKVKEWINKLNKYPTRFKSFKSFYL